MKRSTLTLSTLAVAFVLALPATAATPTEISDLSASATGSTVAVAGKVAFGGQDPVLVGEDASGDNAGGAAGAAVGLDLQQLLIAQAGSGSNLEFTIDLAGLAGGGVPQLFQYNWDIEVDGGPNAGGSSWSIKAMVAGTAASSDTDPYAALYSCVPDPDSPTGGFTCSSLQDLPVVLDEAQSQIRLTVPATSIGAKPGSTIDAWARNGQPVWVRTSAAGALTGFVTADDMSHDTYTLPARTLELGMASAGTPEADVVFTKPVTPASNGSFSSSFTGVGSGSHDVWARACSGESCATATVPVSVG